MFSWQYLEIYTCILAYLWTYSVKGNLWCLHGYCNLSFWLSLTSLSNGKIPGFHHLSCIEFSACPMWLLKKWSDCLPKEAVHASQQYCEYVSIGEFTTSIPSVAQCLFQYLPVMNGLVCASVLGQFEYRFFVRYAFFRKTILFIFGCAGPSWCVLSLVWVSVGHN